MNSKGYIPLSYYQLAKRGGYRFSILNDKIKNNEDFFTIKGNVTLTYATSSHEIIFEHALCEDIRNISCNINNHVLFLDEKGHKYCFTNLFKTPEFGGKGKGSGTLVEDYNLLMLNEKIKELLKIYPEGLDIKINNVIYRNIIKAETQKGFPKSDFNLIDKNNKPVIFISHKKAGKIASAKDFIRWGGFTEYVHHPEVINFNTIIKYHLNTNNILGIPKKSKFIHPIKDDLLIQHLIYGKDYGNEFGQNNVNLICQGNINLIHISNNLFNLVSQHTLINGDIPQDDYYPYLTSTYRGDRKMFGILNNEAICSTKLTSFSASNIYLLGNNTFTKINYA